MSLLADWAVLLLYCALLVVLGLLKLQHSRFLLFMVVLFGAGAAALGALLARGGPSSRGRRPDAPSGDRSG